LKEVNNLQGKVVYHIETDSLYTLERTFFFASLITKPLFRIAEKKASIECFTTKKALNKDGYVIVGDL
jgi:hypothetical protein